MLTIFYDGKCPLCSIEMQHLKQLDTYNRIILVDLHQENFTTLHPEIDVTDAMKILHASYDGKILLGLEVTHKAWTLVGKGFWVAPLNWPVIKQLSHVIYLIVAKYRQQISVFIAKIFRIKTVQCNAGACYDKSTNTHHRRK
ncbi:thiol-disulfide oxidoreductase DCC family protein [Thalassotalea piscium]|uniref:Putative DCC family thiol-disulfide oxidoreductase YuxK n=1 Tax=Thalassotalea piscium TaxID=1230533 RepID=A0A7X0NI32_9GAMM|nr:DUF393 domain-containing protein [Thalassotalea piscium]MBB6543770.1 putative DCC family thiol-disulfide oxidoreductase YuxK [Thalassotalea piscium]